MQTNKLTYVTLVYTKCQGETSSTGFIFLLDNCLSLINKTVGHECVRCSISHSSNILEQKRQCFFVFHETVKSVFFVVYANGCKHSKQTRLLYQGNKYTLKSYFWMSELRLKLPLSLLINCTEKKIASDTVFNFLDFFTEHNWTTFGSEIQQLVQYGY